MADRAPSPNGGMGVTKKVASTTSEPTSVSSVTPVKVRCKRRRTRSHNSSPSPGRGFFVPGFDANGFSGSGCKKMSLSDLMNASNGVTNMFLAHEIAVDKDFMLDKLEEENDETTEDRFDVRIRQIVHRAFWDALASELSNDPPVFSRALSLLEEVRSGLINMLLPSQHRIKTGILERLDLDLIKQQAENGSLDIEAYATYVLDMMGKLCAPVRDEEIKVLKEMDKKDVVPLFRGIMKTLDRMRVDMTNFMIQQARPLIMSQSVEYEKMKFKEFLETQVDGLESTRAWLKRHAPSDEEEDTLRGRESETKFQKLLMNRVLTDSFVELLEWDDYNPLPETLAMDWKRIASLRDQTERVSVSTSVILVAFSNVSGLIIPADAQKLKETIKSHTDVLLKDFNDDTDLLRILPNVGLQVVKDVNEYLQSKQKEQLPESTVKNLRDQIDEMEDPNHKIRDLVQRRIVEFAKQAISISRTTPLQIPPGLTLCQKELGQIAGNFVRLVSYNRAVFGEFYSEIIENHVLFKAPNVGIKEQ